MHELSVCQALIEQVQGLARRHGAATVHRIVLQIGPLSGVEPDLLARAYRIARAGTAAAGAELVIESGATRVWCADCETESPVPPNRLVCPRCSGWRTRLTAGDELLLARVEMGRPAKLH